MVSRDEMARIALRHDTLMAAAMRRALGIEGRAGSARHGRVSTPDRRWNHLDWCFENHGSPMDGA